MPFRFQVAVYDRLVAEAIFETSEECSAALHRYFRLKYARGLPIGGAVERRADLPRTWDVKVGGRIL